MGTPNYIDTRVYTVAVLFQPGIINVMYTVAVLFQPGIINVIRIDGLIQGGVNN